jgi:hypothetical protein
MRMRLILWLLAMGAFVAVVPNAHGEWHQAVGRYLGVYWGDGYHSRTNCPPKHAQHAPSLPTAKPWWAIPAAEAEPLPHPAATRPVGPVGQLPLGQ